MYGGLLHRVAKVLQHPCSSPRPQHGPGHYLVRRFRVHPDLRHVPHTLNIKWSRHVAMQKEATDSACASYKIEALAHLRRVVDDDSSSATNGKANLVSQGWALCQMVTGLFWAQFQALGYDWTTYRKYVVGGVDLQGTAYRLFSARSCAEICSFDTAILASLLAIFGITLAPSSAPYRQETLSGSLTPACAAAMGRRLSSLMDEAAALWSWVNCMIVVPQLMSLTHSRACVNFSQCVVWEPRTTNPVAWDGARYLPSADLIKLMSSRNVAVVSSELSALFRPNSLPRC